LPDEVLQRVDLQCVTIEKVANRRETYRNRVLSRQNIRNDRVKRENSSQKIQNLSDPAAGVLHRASTSQQSER
jgi:hypothetical protein